MSASTRSSVLLEHVPSASRVSLLRRLLHEEHDGAPGDKLQAAVELLLLLEGDKNIDQEVQCTCRRLLVCRTLQVIQSADDAGLSTLAATVPQCSSVLLQTLAVILAKLGHVPLHHALDNIVLSSIMVTDILGSSFELEDDFIALQAQITSASRCLVFLKYLFLRGPLNFRIFSGSLFILLTALLACTDSGVAIASSEAAHAYVSSIEALHDLEIHEQGRTIWKAITIGLNLQHSNPARCSQSLSLWLRLLSSNPCSRLVLPWRKDADTFHHIRHTLSNGTREQQKLALAILRVYINDELGDTTCDRNRAVQLARFASVYESIALVGYVNQAEEALPALSSLANTEASIEPSWLMAFLRAIFCSSFQSSIRKMIADWLLQSSQGLLPRAGLDGIHFLEHSFLPWAAIGTFYVTSIIYDEDSAPSCSHGQKLSQFLKETIVASLSTEDHGLDSVAAVMRFLVGQRHRITPYARAFMLEGLSEGIEKTRLQLGKRHEAALIELSSTTNFIEIAQEYMDTLISNLRLFVASDGDTPSNVNISSKIVLEYEIFEKESSNTRAAQVPRSMSISKIRSNIEGTRYRYLAGNGLLQACNSLRSTLDTSKGSSEAALDLQLILEAIWEESEIQAHPRTILLVVPHLVFHEFVARLLPQAPGLLNISTKILDMMTDLAPSRVYVFTSLAEAWHSVMKSAPDDSLNLCLFKFFDGFTRVPPATQVEFEMEAIFADKLSQRGIAKSYEDHYGKPLSIGYAYVFSMLARLPRTAEMKNCIQAFIDSLLRPWISLKSPSTVWVSWKSATQLRVLIILNEHVVPHVDTEEANIYLKHYLHILALEQSPRYRYLLEWIIARLCHHHPLLSNTILLQQAEFNQDNPKYAASIIRLTIILAGLPRSTEEFAAELSTQFLVLAASTRVAVRHEAQWSIPKLWNLANKRSWNRILHNDAFSRLNKWIQNLDLFREPPASRLFDEFDTITDHTLVHLIEGRYLQMEPREHPACRYKDFVRLQDECKATDIEDNGLVMPLGERPPSLPSLQQNRPNATDPPLSTPAPVALAEQSSLTPLQTKSFVDPLLSQNSGTTRPTPLHIVASLISSGPNLGGLCRLSEVLGVQALHIPSLATTSDKNFTSLSVSSHLHLPLSQLAPSELPAFLREKKLAGYEVVGVEQTDSSRVLGDLTAEGEQGLRKEARFRKDGKTVLLLGSEREGIPGEFLGDCDWCVEIRQRGVTRSMNVQTAAAVVAWEWGRQREHNLKAKEQ